MKDLVIDFMTTDVPMFALITVGWIMFFIGYGLGYTRGYLKFLDDEP